MGDVAITTKNIEEYRGSLTIRRGDLEFGLWQVFHRGLYEAIPSDSRLVLPISKVISPKDELQDKNFLAGLKPDPRQTAFDWMRKAGQGQALPRPPLRVIAEQDGMFRVEDGNATVQVAMLAGWKEVPVELVRAGTDSAFRRD